MPLKRVGWYVKLNAPWLGAPKGLVPRGDVWLASRGELHVLTRVLAGMLRANPDVVRRVLAPNIVFHRIPSQYREFAVEIWGHGLRLGAAEYVPGSGWTVYPSGALASLLEAAGVEPVVVGRRGRLKGKRIELSECDRELVLVASGRHVGPARRVRRCVYRVRDMAPRGFRLLEPSTLEAAAEANRAYISRLAAEAREFIRSHAGRERVVYAAVSGGADSTASAILAVRALGAERVRLVYADTGMEFPESRRQVEKLAGWLGVELDVVSSGLDPIGEIVRRGFMARDNRWCTRLLKLRPLSQYYRRRGARIVVDGARMFESQNRAKLPRAGVNPLIPFVKRLLPIHSWTRLEVQLYLRLENAPVNPLYEEGFTRLGCIICPAMSLHEIELAYKRYPSFYMELSRRTGMPLDRILGGEWRRTRSLTLTRR